MEVPFGWDSVLGVSLLCSIATGIPSVGGNIENFAEDGDALCPETRQKWLYSA